MKIAPIIAAICLTLCACSTRSKGASPSTVETSPTTTAVAATSTATSAPPPTTTTTIDYATTFTAPIRTVLTAENTFTAAEYALPGEPPALSQVAALTPPLLAAYEDFNALLLHTKWPINAQADMNALIEANQKEIADLTAVRSSTDWLSWSSTEAGDYARIAALAKQAGLDIGIPSS